MVMIVLILTMTAIFTIAEISQAINWLVIWRISVLNFFLDTYKIKLYECKPIIMCKGLLMFSGDKGKQ